MRSTWRFVVKIVGASLALAGLVCLVVGYWDRMIAGCTACGKALTGKCRNRCSEFDDYDDDLLYEE